MTCITQASGINFQEVTRSPASSDLLLGSKVGLNLSLLLLLIPAPSSHIVLPSCAHVSFLSSKPFATQRGARVNPLYSFAVGIRNLINEPDSCMFELGRVTVWSKAGNSLSCHQLTGQGPRTGALNCHLLVHMWFYVLSLLSPSLKPEDLAHDHPSLRCLED